MRGTHPQAQFMSFKPEFYTRKVHELTGGLIIQLVHRRTENGAISENVDFTHSLIVSEDGFILVEPIFVRHSSLPHNAEKWAYYHYGFHVHTQNQVQMILTDLSALLNQYELNEIDEAPEITTQKIKVIKAIVLFLKNNLHHPQYYGIYVYGI